MLDRDDHGARFASWRRLAAGLAFALARTPALAARRRSCLPRTIDGPSEDIVGFGGVAMAEDGTGRASSTCKRVGRRRARVRRALPRRALAGADPRRRRRALRRELAADRRRRRRRARRRVGDPVRDRKRTRPSTSCSARRSARARSPFGPAMIDRPRHPRRHRHEPRPRDELDRAGRRRLPRRLQQPQRATGGDPAAAPGRRDRGRAGGALQRRNLVAARRDQPQLRRLDASADGSQRAGDRDQPDRQRRWSSGRSPTSTASRGSGRGGSSARVSTTCCRSAPRASTASPIGDDADAPSVAISSLGEARSPTARRVRPGSPLPGPRIFLNILPDGESESGVAVQGRRDRRLGGLGRHRRNRRSAERRYRRKAGNAPALRQRTGPRG